MEISVWITFIAFSFLYCLFPGPSVCFTIAHSIRHGILRTNLSIFGQISANSLYIIIVCFGLGNLIESSIEVFQAVKYIGALYIIYLGIKQLFSRESHFEFEINSVQKSRLKSFVDGFVICGTNPKTFFYYSAYLPQFLISRYNKRIQLIALGLGSIVIALIILMLYNYAGNKAKDFLLKKSFFHYSHYVVGSLLITAGVILGFL